MSNLYQILHTKKKKTCARLSDLFDSFIDRQQSDYARVRLKLVKRKSRAYNGVT